MTIPEILPLIRAYYAKPDNGVGGSLHIVLEDRNIDDKSVKWCIEQAEKEDDADGTHLGRLLLSMSRTQRKKLASIPHYPEYRA